MTAGPIKVILNGFPRCNEPLWVTSKHLASQGPLGGARRAWHPPDVHAESQPVAASCGGNTDSCPAFFPWALGRGLNSFSLLFVRGQWGDLVEAYFSHMVPNFSGFLAMNVLDCKTCGMSLQSSVYYFIFGLPSVASYLIGTKGRMYGISPAEVTFPHILWMIPKSKQLRIRTQGSQTHLIINTTLLHQAKC